MGVRVRVKLTTSTPGKVSPAMAIWCFGCRWRRADFTVMTTRPAFVFPEMGPPNR